MFNKKTVASITKQFHTMVTDLDIIIDDVTNSLLAIDNKIATLLENKNEALDEMKQAMVVRKNLNALLGE